MLAEVDGTPDPSEYLMHHATELGRLVGNLQSLEFLIRIFLYERRSRPHRAFRRGQNLSGLSEGAILPENAVTDYDSLTKLISRYNRIARRSFRGHEVDPDVVRIRDAVAHGRVWADQAGPPLWLMKFSKPHAQLATVEFAVRLTAKWLADQATRVGNEIAKVHGAITMSNARRRRTA